MMRLHMYPAPTPKQVASLKKSGEYDVLVIGGGATGVGEQSLAILRNPLIAS